MIKLIAYVSAGFATLVTAFLGLLGRKLIISGLAITTFLALTVAFLFSLQTIISSIVSTLSLPLWLASIAWFIPANFLLVFSSIISARIARAAYDMAVLKLKLINSSS